MLALPAIWKGRDPPFVADSLLEALVSLMRVDAARVQLEGATGVGSPLENWRPRGPKPPDLPWADADAGPTCLERAGTARPVRLASARERVLDAQLRVVVASGRTTFPTESERFVLRATVEQAALAIEASMVLDRERAEREAAERARADEQRARAELETINRLGQILAAELDLQKLVQAVTDAATEVTRAHFGAFFYNVVDDAGERYTLYTISGVPREAFSRFPLPRNTHLFGPTFRGEGVIRLDDVRRDPRYGRSAPHHGMPPGHLPVVSYLAVPVASRSGEVIGGLFFGHPEPAVFTPADERVVSALAAQAAVAMDNARLYQQAQQALQARDRFLAGVSHDLRTPLTAIKGYAQVLRRISARVEGPHAPRLNDGLAQIEVTAGRMNGMINELLDVARLELGQALELDLAPVDLAEVVRRMVAATRVSDEGIALRLETGSDDLVGRWDGARLERVVENLLTNAAKYSPQGGEILVRLAREVDGRRMWAVLTVEDHGIGIPAADLPHVFDRFFRAKNTAGKIAGSGLGLAGVREIVERHGGAVGVESREGEGSAFTVRLPLEDADAAPVDGAGLSVSNDGNA